MLRCAPPTVLDFRGTNGYGLPERVTLCTANGKFQMTKITYSKKALFVWDARAVNSYAAGRALLEEQGKRERDVIRVKGIAE